MITSERLKVIAFIVFLALLVIGLSQWEDYTWNQATVTYKAQMRQIAPEPERLPSDADTRLANMKYNPKTGLYEVRRYK